MHVCIASCLLSRGAHAACMTVHPQGIGDFGWHGISKKVKDLVEQLPVRANQFLELLVTNRVKLDVDAIDESLLMSGFQKVANRITIGILLASLILGSALLMRVETEFRLFGYPGFAILFFLTASRFGLSRDQHRPHRLEGEKATPRVRVVGKRSGASFAPRETHGASCPCYVGNAPAAAALSDHFAPLFSRFLPCEFRCHAG